MRNFWRNFKDFLKESILDCMEISLKESFPYDISGGSSGEIPVEIHEGPTRLIPEKKPGRIQ